VEAVASSLLPLAAWTMSRQGLADPVPMAIVPASAPSQGAGDVADGGGAAVVEGLAGAEVLDVDVPATDLVRSPWNRRPGSALAVR